jgi:hypothetical protein
MDFLIQKWPNILFLILYLVFFFPIITLDLIFVVFYCLLPLTSIFLPRKAYVYFRDVIFLGIAHKINFTKVGRISKNVQLDLTDNITFFLPRNTLVYPLQKWISEQNRRWYKAIFKWRKCKFPIEDEIDDEAAIKSEKNLLVRIFEGGKARAIDILFFPLLLLYASVLSFPLVIFIILCVVLF